MTPDEHARRIVDKFFEKYTPDELKEMSTVNLEAVLIKTINEIALDEDLAYDIFTHVLIGRSSHEKGVNYE